MTALEKLDTRRGRAPVASLTALSNYVRTRMPSVLAMNPRQVSVDAERFARNLDFVRKKPSTLPQNLRRQVMVDLKMLESAIVHSGLTAPRSLTALIDALAGPNEVKGLTYEDIVLTNRERTLRPKMVKKSIVAVPGQRKMRTFTNGAVGASEAQFYKHHADIEALLGKTIKAVRRALNAIQSGRPHNISALLPTIRRDLDRVVHMTSQSGAMPSGHFGLFRTFLGSNVARGARGPSGAFTARVPTLEVMLRGSNGLEASYRKSLDDHRAYLPQRDRAGLERALGGPSLSDAHKKNPRSGEILELIQVLDGFFSRFRSAHYGAVAKQVPEALRGTVPGTAGETDVAGYLKTRRNQPKPWIQKV
ncbi:MAG: hypothetical protein AAB573_02265 [Patescibacteria group bacterium]